MSHQPAAASAVAARNSHYKRVKRKINARLQPAGREHFSVWRSVPWEHRASAPATDPTPPQTAQHVLFCTTLPGPFPFKK